jgi:hypothetical protein
MTKTIDIPRLLGYAVGTVSLLFGLSIIVNIWNFLVPPITRNMFGIVLVLLGVYRFSVISLQKRRDMRRKFDD